MTEIEWGEKIQNKPRVLGKVDRARPCSQDNSKWKVVTGKVPELHQEMKKEMKKKK